MPVASHTSFVRHLSIASAEAITPLPVYGMRIASSAPCTMPSSPKRPCSAMNARAKPSAARSESGRSFGSNACASTPRSRSAASTALPDRNEISRSDDGPPINTATLPNSLIGRHLRLARRRRFGRERFAEDLDLGRKLDARLVAHDFAHVDDQRLDVGGARAAAGIHDEVRVLLGHARRADR